MADPTKKLSAYTLVVTEWCLPGHIYIRLMKVIFYVITSLKLFQHQLQVAEFMACLFQIFLRGGEVEDGIIPLQGQSMQLLLQTGQLLVPLVAVRGEGGGREGGRGGRE